MPGLLAGTIKIRPLALKIEKDSGVKFETVRKRISRRLKLGKGHVQREHGNRAFTTSQERAIIALILALSSMSVPCTTQQLLRWINEGFKLDVGEKALRGLFKRNKDKIGMYKLEPLEESRQNPKIIDNAIKFLDLAEQLLGRVNSAGDNLVNIDETTLNSVTPQVGTNAPRHGYLMPRREKIRTIVMAVTAAGDVLVELRIFADPDKADDTTVATAAPRDVRAWPVYYAVTDHGFMDSKLWKDLMEKVVSRYNESRSALPPVLLLDHHTTHEQLDALQFLHENGWQTLFFPPHTTHFLQPLDDVCFAQFKRTLEASFSERLTVHALNRTRPENVVGDAIDDASRDAFTKEAIVQSFANVGMHPFDRNIVIAKMEKLFGHKHVQPVLTPLEEADRLTLNRIKNNLAAAPPIARETVCKAPAKSQMFLGEEMIDFELREAPKRTSRQPPRQPTQEIDVITDPAPKRAKNSEFKSVPREIACDLCGAVRMANVRWKLCGLCEDFRACEYCANSSNIFHNHVDKCGTSEVILTQA